MGIDKTYELISKYYFWPVLYNEVVGYVNSYFVCQAQSRVQEASPLMETDLPENPFQKVSMDISGPYIEFCRLVDYLPRCISHPG